MRETSEPQLHRQNQAATALQMKFSQAITLHQQGRIIEAESIYREILRRQPEHFDALHLLGVIAIQTRHTEQGVELIRKAIGLNANNAAAYQNLGKALLDLKRPDEALASYDKAIALKPDYAEAYNSRGNVQLRLKHPDEALADYEKAIALRPDYAEAHNSRGSALLDLERPEEALASYNKAIALKRDFAGAYNNRGNALRNLKRLADALASYNKAIALKPNFAEAYNNRGNMLSYFNRQEEALASYDKAIALKPDYAEAYNNRGLALRDLKRPDEALANYDRAITLEKNFAEAHWNKSLCLLQLGRFEQGWLEYEWRWKIRVPRSSMRSFPKPLWLGEDPLVDKAILLYSEQGFGDTIQFCRYAKLVADLGARVILEVPNPLISLLGNLSGVAQLAKEGSPLPQFDYQCPLVSLPLAFKTNLSNIPAKIPYLNANLEKSRFWKEKLGEKDKLRVGLVWSGGFRPNQPEVWAVNLRRNIPLEKLALLKDPDIEFYSLQKGEPAESELGELISRHWDGPHIFDFTSLLNDFSDTAAFVENLDLVISVDTATAHLAGALGKPVWILNRFDSDWRWLLDRTDSPWYPTARLYGQQKVGDWDNVVRRVKTDLVRFCG